MKKLLSLALIAVLGMSVVSCNKSEKTSPLVDSISTQMGEISGGGLAMQLSMRGQEDSTFTFNKDAVYEGIMTVLKADTTDDSFMIGLQVGMQMKEMFTGIKAQTGVEINQKTFAKALKKAFFSDSTLTQEQLMQMQMQIQPMLDRAHKEMLENDPKAKENKDAGIAYIKKMSANKDYKKTKSGVLYKVINAGEGANFTESDMIMTKYVGKHVDGKPFDDSKGQAVPFSCGRVIPGFAEVLLLMKPGAKFEVVIPSELAYGIEGQKDPMGNPVIGPNETLIFVLETVGTQTVQAPDGREVPVTSAY